MAELAGEEDPEPALDAIQRFVQVADHLGLDGLLGAVWKLVEAHHRKVEGVQRGKSTEVLDRKYLLKVDKELHRSLKKEGLADGHPDLMRLFIRCHDDLKAFHECLCQRLLGVHNLWPRDSDDDEVAKDYLRPAPSSEEREGGVS